MFRIKTDIRQFKCKDRDKVDRLIRNWVIRPADLIFDGDSDQWKPIGEHPNFVELFASLDEAHQNQPDTVITDRAADKAANDRANSGPQDLQKPETKRSAPKAAVLRPAASITKKEPPTPSKDVEGVIRDSGEITMMTDRTLDLLREDAPGSTTASEPSEAPVIEDATEDIFIPDSDEIPAAPSEDTALTERPTFEEHKEDEQEDEFETAAPDEDTALVERPTFNDQEETDDPSLTEAPSVEEDSSVEESAPKLGRHDLPEEVFATAELPGQGLSRKDVEQERLDELGDIDDEGITLTGEESMGSRHESPSRWNIVLADMKPPAEETVEKNDAPIDEKIDPLRDTADLDREALAAEKDLRDTDKLEQEKPQKPAAVKEDLDDTADITEELTHDARQKPDDADEGVDPDEDLRDTADLTPAATAAAAMDSTEETEEIDKSEEDLITAEPVGDEFEIDDDALDDAIVDLEASAIAAREMAESEEDLEEIPLLSLTPLQNKDRVSGGYQMEFLTPIKPSEEVLQLGLQRSKVSVQRRDLRYSLPKPKKSSQVIRAEYDLPPKRSFPPALIAVAIVTMIIVGLLLLILAT